MGVIGAATKGTVTVIWPRRGRLCEFDTNELSPRRSLDERRVLEVGLQRKSLSRFDAPTPKVLLSRSKRRRKAAHRWDEMMSPIELN